MLLVQGLFAVLAEQTATMHLLTTVILSELGAYDVFLLIEQKVTVISKE